MDKRRRFDFLSFGRRDGRGALAILVLATVVVTVAVPVAMLSSAPKAAAADTPAIVNNDPPSIYGTATDAQTLNASTGTWSGVAPISYSYQWQDCDATGANCSDIGGATASSYTLVPGDDGYTVRVVVTASNSAGAGQAASSPSAVVTEDQASVVTPRLSQYDSALTSDTPAQTPALTSADTTTAHNAVAADSRVASIVAAANTNVSTVMSSATMNSWTSIDGSKLLGATMYLPLPAPATITTDWPLVHYDQQELTTHAYTAGTLHFTASNVTALLVTIDLTRNAVVSVEPDPGATISNLPPNFPTTPQPGGES